MAIYHLTAKTIGRSQGRSATAAAAYRAGVRIVDERTGLVFDFTRKRGVDGAEIIAPSREQPERGALWNAVEKSEKRSDAQVAREIELALPRELPPEEMRALVRLFVRDQFVALGMVADVAFHHLTGTNPHAHILLTLRAWTEQGFGLKQREWNERALCLQWREVWARYANEALARTGHADRIDHRTLLEQAAEALEQNRMSDAATLDRAPTIHERGNRTAKAHNARVRQANHARRAEWNDELAPANEIPPLVATPRTKAKATRQRTRAEALAEAQAAFLTDMRGRDDLTARKWKQHDADAAEASAWLSEHAGEEAQRLKARDDAVVRLDLARVKRDEWLRTHRRPFWPWARSHWRKKRDAFQRVVDKAKQVLARTDAQASPEAFNQWQRTCSEKRRERDEALTARRALAATPLEMEAQAQRRNEARQTERERAARMTLPRSQQEHEHTPSPRPRARPR
ncbi:MobQ family relaxase [Dokdonella sp.]|uniref:MobQ family relaxase n=1 Tax=Dokdonella sp. TaxID=2291710 RepID=UPI0027BA1182|nr:MobQ family relaxase [Dokdonella sp.]